MAAQTPHRHQAHGRLHSSLRQNTSIYRHRDAVKNSALATVRHISHISFLNKVSQLNNHDSISLNPFHLSSAISSAYFPLTTTAEFRIFVHILKQACSSWPMQRDDPGSHPSWCSVSSLWPTTGMLQCPELLIEAGSSPGHLVCRLQHNGEVDLGVHCLFPQIPLCVSSLSPSWVLAHWTTIQAPPKSHTGRLELNKGCARGTSPGEGVVSAISPTMSFFHLNTLPSGLKSSLALWYAMYSTASPNSSILSVFLICFLSHNAVKFLLSRVLFSYSSCISTSF